jgi:hypothetical protein
MPQARTVSTETLYQSRVLVSMICRATAPPNRIEL